MWKTSDSQTQVRYLERCISGNLWPKDLVIFESLTMHSGNIYNWAIKDKRVKKQLVLSGHSKVVLSTSQLLGRSGRSMGGEDKEGNALSRCLMFCKSSSLRYWSFPLPLLLHLSEMLYGHSELLLSDFIAVLRTAPGWSQLTLVLICCFSHTVELIICSNRRIGRWKFLDFVSPQWSQ